MRKIPLSKAIAPLAEYVQQVGEEPVILTDRGRPVAALLSLENADWETVTLSTHPGFLALVERSRTRQRAKGGISPADMRRRLGLRPPPPGV